MRVGWECGLVLSDDIYTHAELGELATVVTEKEEVRPPDRNAAILRTTGLADAAGVLQVQEGTELDVNGRRTSPWSMELRCLCCCC